MGRRIQSFRLIAEGLDSEPKSVSRSFVHDALVVVGADFERFDLLLEPQHERDVTDSIGAPLNNPNKGRAPCSQLIDRVAHLFLHFAIAEGKSD